MRQIGDVVFTTPAVRALRQRFPDAHISYVVESAAAAVVACNPHLDEVIDAPPGRGLAQLLRDLALSRRLRASRYDIAIDFHGGPRSALLTWLSRAPLRIGYDIAWRGWMYTRRIHRPRALRPRHSVENQWDLLDDLGIPRPDRSHFPVEMVAEAGAAGRADARLAATGVGAVDRVIVVHVSAGNPFRRWPLEAFAALVSALAAGGPDRRVVVTSGPSERTAATRVISEARARLGATDERRVVLCDEFSIAELRALLDRAALYIGGDSGPLHIAATTRVPIVGLYGPTLPARSAPWRAPHLPTEAVEVDGLPCRPCDQRVCAPGDFRCLTWLGPDQVIQTAERLLDART